MDARVDQTDAKVDTNSDREATGSDTKPTRGTPTQTDRERNKGGRVCYGCSDHIYGFHGPVVVLGWVHKSRGREVCEIEFRHVHQVYIRVHCFRYCPPKLATLGTVWGIFSATGK
jgi:hypothetical protein